MEKQNIDLSVQTANILNNMDRETFILMCKQLNNKRKRDIEYFFYLSFAYEFYKDELNEKKYTKQDVDEIVNRAISEYYEDESIYGKGASIIWIIVKITCEKNEDQGWLK